LPRAAVGNATGVAKIGLRRTLILITVSKDSYRMSESSAVAISARDDAQKLRSLDRVDAACTVTNRIGRGRRRCNEGVGYAARIGVATRTARTLGCERTLR